MNWLRQGNYPATPHKELHNDHKDHKDRDKDCREDHKDPDPGTKDSEAQSFCIASAPNGRDDQADNRGDYVAPR